MRLKFSKVQTQMCRVGITHPTISKSFRNLPSFRYRYYQAELDSEQKNGINVVAWEREQPFLAVTPVQTPLNRN